MPILSPFRSKISIGLLSLITGCSGLPQTPLEVYQQRLFPCPIADNCVISDSNDPAHYLPAWTAKPTPEKTKLKLMDILRQHPNIKIISHSEFYIHSQYRSDWFGFVDDMEFLIQENTVQIRSASRLGYSDFGANKKHLLAIEKAYYQP